MSPDTPSLARPAALIVVAALLVAAGLFARDTAQRITGPLAVAVRGDAVTVAAPGVLYRLDAAGKLLGTDRDLLDPAARDAGLAWIGDALLVSPGRGGKLLRCVDNACAPFSGDPYAPTGPVQAAPSIPGRLWLAETDADRAHRFYEDGRRIDMPLSDLQRPGSLWEQDDQLYVCNTGAGKFERHELHKRGIAEAEVVAQFPAAVDDEDPANRPLRLLARADGGFRLALTNAGRTHGRLVDVGADGSVRDVDVAGLVSPVSLAMLGDATLVVDEDRMQVLAVDASGKAAAFGDRDFRAAISARAQERDILRLVFPACAVLATLLAALGGSWLLQRLAQRRSDPPLPVAAGPDGIAWLPTLASLAPRRALQQAVVALPLALVPAIAAGMAGIAMAGMAWAVAVLAAAAVPALLAGNRGAPPAGLRIGLHGKALVIGEAERGMREYRLAMVAWDANQLQPEPGTSIALARDGIDFFHRPTLDASLFPLLDPARRIAG